MNYQYIVYKDYIPLVLNRINKKDIIKKIKEKGLTIFKNSKIDVYRLGDFKYIKSINN